MPRMRAQRSFILFLGIALLLAGCAGLTVPEEPPKPTPAEPVWFESEIQEHLRFFNSNVTEGRATGTFGYGRASAYLASRFEQYELQPVLGNQYGVVYYTPLNHILSATATSVGRDTLRYLPGRDFFVDGRSDSGIVRIRHVFILAGHMVPEGERAWTVPEFLDRHTAVALPASRADTPLLKKLRSQGVRTILTVGEHAPAPSDAKIDGLVLVQFTPQSATGMLESNLSPTLSGDVNAPQSIRLGRELRLSVTNEYLLQAGAINTMGFVAGKRPVLSSELVIVCSDLDGLGQFMGVRRLDFDDLGVATAALLEVARNFSYFGQITSIPERTILFAVWSGSRMHHAGLKAYLRNPMWSLAETKAVLYIGLREEEEREVRELLSPHHIDLRNVPIPDGLVVPASIEIDRTAGRSATTANEGAKSASNSQRFSTLLDAAIPVVVEVAHTVHDVLIPLVVTPGPFRPYSADSLLIPSLPSQ